jgi:hypothetical protein
MLCGEGRDSPRGTRPVLFHVVRPAAPPLVVEADDHRREGGWHVFRRDTLVMGRPRTVVVLRLQERDVVELRRS